MTQKYSFKRIKNFIYQNFNENLDVVGSNFCLKSKYKCTEDHQNCRKCFFEEFKNSIKVNRKINTANAFAFTYEQLEAFINSQFDKKLQIKYPQFCLKVEECLRLKDCRSCFLKEFKLILKGNGNGSIQ